MMPLLFKLALILAAAAAALSAAVICGCSVPRLGDSTLLATGLRSRVACFWSRLGERERSRREAGAISLVWSNLDRLRGTAWSVMFDDEKE